MCYRVTFLFKINNIKEVRISYEKKNKRVEFKVNIVDYGDHVSNNTNENITKSISLLANNFRKVMRRLYKRHENNVSLNVKEIKN